MEKLFLTWIGEPIGSIALRDIAHPYNTLWKGVAVLVELLQSVADLKPYNKLLALRRALKLVCW